MVKIKKQQEIVSAPIEEVEEKHEVQEVVSSALSQITRSEIDMQVATAKKWPRNIKKFRMAKQGILIAIMALIYLACFPFMATGAWADDIGDIVPAIIQIESHGNSYAISPCGAIGLMQVTPIVLREYNEDTMKNYIGCYENGFLAQRIAYRKKDLFNARINKQVGTWYLRRLKNYYLKDKFTVERMLAAYNGGITRLRKVDYNVNRMPRESRNYVKKVMAIYRRSK